MPRTRTIIATAALAVLALTSVAWAQDTDNEPEPVQGYAGVADAFWTEAENQRAALSELWDQCYITGTTDDPRYELQAMALHVIGLYDLAIEYGTKLIDDLITVGDLRGAVEITSAFTADRASMQRWYDYTTHVGLSPCIAPEEPDDNDEAEAE